ncbi:hypothetical protein [Psychromonas sp. MME1]|uniref:aldose epimerase family protein n=1 Tax=Psychromonas sp. MME1 TaxID=3231032 RepID=UPI0034E2804F
MQFAATAYSAKSGLFLRVYADQSGLQFYSGNFLKNVTGRNGQTYQQYAGLCLETQHYPDQINMDTYKKQCIYTPQRPYKHKVIFQLISNENS